MITDLSLMDPMILQIAIGAILLLGVIIGYFTGFIKTLFNLAGYVVYILLMMIVLNPVTTFLSNFKFIENLVETSGIQSSAIYQTLEPLLPKVIAILYNIIAVLGLLIIGWILVKILGLIFNKLLKPLIQKFKIAKWLNRALGVVVSLLVAVAVATVGLTVVSSELLFTGGQTWIDNSGYVKGFNQITSDIRVSLLCNNGIVCSVESALASTLGGQDMSPTQLKQTTETLGRIDEIIADPTAYLGQVVNENGTINGEGLSTVIADMAVMSTVAQNFNMTETILGLVGGSIDQAISAVPADAQIEMTAQDVENLNTIKTNMNLSPSQAAAIDDLIANNIIIIGG